MPSKKKILFAGLDRAGKTSILHSLQNKFSMIKTKPTLGAVQGNVEQTKWLGFEFSSWDLGGQKKFRDTHFAKSFMFKNVFAVFYVIDVQDTERYEESNEYLKSFLQKFTDESDKPTIVICLNKFDPIIQENKEIQEKITQLIANVTETCKNFEHSIHHTSIFEQESLMRMFYEGIIKLTPKSKMIQDYLTQYAQLTFSSAVVLMDESCLIVGSHASNPHYVLICQSIAPWVIMSIERIKRYSIELEGIAADINFTKPIVSKLDGEEETAKVFLHFFKADNMKFTLITLTRNKRTTKLNEKNLPILAEKMAEFIKIMTLKEE
jgi:small GTP-binding protein